MTNTTKLLRRGLLPVTLALTLAVPAFAQSTASPEKPVPVDKRYENEVKALAKNPAVKNAFKVIMELEPETLQDLILLTEIPAPPFKEEARGKKYAQMLQAAGADSVWIDEVGNVLARRKGKNGRKTVVMEAHLDTVFPEGTDVKVKQRGDTLLAPGIADDTRGLAMVLSVLKVLEKTGLETEADVLFIGTVGEEGLGDLRGVKHLFSEKGPKIDSYIAVDGTGIGAVTNRGLGSRRYRITFKGPGGHSSGAFGLVNPHNALGRAIHYFAVDADKFTREGIRTTYNVGVIGGGTSVNSIPFESWMEVDMRSESPERVAGIDRLLQAAVQRALQEENQMKRSGPDLKVEVNLIGERPAGGMEPTVALAQRAVAATRFLGTEPALRVGSTNSNIPFSKGVPAVTIGSGGTGGGAHALEEWWVKKNAHLGTQRALLLLLAETGLAKGKK
ncbi:M20/M25/M40 family metallo-hydrolase [Rufibacter glacialis]|uniref:M20/M25/M40 family metallo-hydrolase n=1 Tax=Rufibacter glacialis TaxID=1259555 RepID=A0A5M8Q7V1_9BACT|nr:M20/M25/M40 family metallo-hydrolase [Rufibacter glacialis]KAA6431024.1 M20/M25/M40 family metallo-hydrolase [Rufibacter glacialis]GGK83380.1 aminoacyl-histidine dipeptidase [Rufibacter glacialis]